VLNIIVLVIDLGRSYGNVRSGRSLENVLKSLEIHIQNCIWTCMIHKKYYWPWLVLVLGWNIPALKVLKMRSHLI